MDGVTVRRGDIPDSGRGVLDGMDSGLCRHAVFNFDMFKVGLL